MISLSEYILESSANVTTAWMEKMYVEFNNTLFDGKLPKCLLEATKLKNKMLGMFSDMDVQPTADKWCQKIQDVLVF